MNERENHKIPADIAKKMSCGICHFFDQAHEMCTFHKTDRSWVLKLREDEACFDFRPVNFDYAEVDRLIAETHAKTR